MKTIPTGGPLKPSVASPTFELVLGANIASAATISPVTAAHKVTGTATVSTINPPYAGYIGELTLVSVNGFALGGGGNIAYGFTVTAGQRVSLFTDGTTWYPIVGGSGGGSSVIGLKGAYNAAATSADNIIGLGAMGPVLIQDNATPLGTDLFAVQDSTGGTEYFSVDALGAYVNGNPVAYDLQSAYDGSFGSKTINIARPLFAKPVIAKLSTGTNRAVGTLDYTGLVLMGAAAANNSPGLAWTTDDTTGNTWAAQLVGTGSLTGNLVFASRNGNVELVTLTDQVTFLSAGGISIANGKIGPSASQQHTLPAVASDTFALLGATQTLTNKTISGASNTLSNIGNASLVNSSVTIAAGTGLAGGGSVALGASTTLNLANTAVAAASYGDASHVGTFTVDAQGRLTAASSTSIQIAESQVTNLVSDLAAKAADSLVVHLAGAETITGSKQFNASVGIGNAPSYLLDIRNATDVSSFHLRTGATSDDGLFINASSAGSATIAVGAKNTGSGVWQAQATNANLIDAPSGSIGFYVNTGLTVGSTFTPSLRLQLTPTELQPATDATLALGDATHRFSALYANTYLGQYWQNPANNNDLVFWEGNGVMWFNFNGDTKFQWTAGVLLPWHDNLVAFGDSGHKLSSIWAYQHAGILQTVAAAATTTISPTNGEFVRITLSATTITSVTISTGQSAQVMTVEVVNDAVGSRAIPTTWTNVRFAGGSYTNTLGTNATDTITFRYNSTDAKWDEIGRAMNIS